MPNIWKWQARDAQGQVVEAAPGMPFFESRGPGSVASMKDAAEIILYNKRLDAIRIGLPDPGYVVDVKSITPVGDSDHGATPIGAWTPDGKAIPINMPNDAAVNEARERELAERQ